MNYNVLDWLLALAPVMGVLLLMVVRGWNTSRAGFSGLALAVLIAALRFEAGAAAIGYAQVKALLLALDVSIIIWAALVLYDVVNRAGALTVIADALAGLTRDSLVQVLLLAWVFASFLQGVGGFGVPVAITAPLLIGLGISQGRAVVAPALGHGWAVTFGSLATSFVMLQNTTGLPGEDLALPAALMLGLLGYLSGLMVAHVIEGWRGVIHALPYVLVVGTAMSGAQLALALAGLYSLGAIGGGLAGLLVSVIWIRVRRAEAQHTRAGVLQYAPTQHTPTNPGDGSSHANASTAEHPSPRRAPSVRLALAGYVILVVLALALRGIAPVKSFLNDQIAIAIDIPETTTGRGWTINAEEDAGFGLLAQPGFVILYACAIAFVLYRRAGLYEPGAGPAILRQSGKRAFKSALGIYAMVAIAATMARAGMIEVLAKGLSDTVPGDLYAFVAPLIGALGAFVTGSNVNSNAVFGMLQLNTARLLGLSALTILGAQTAAAAVISVMSPAKVTVGCSTVGADEGEALRQLLGYGAVVVLVVGVMTWVGLRLA